MAKKLYDLAVKTGSYTDKNGDEKGRYENVGTVWQGDNGPYMVLKRTFNPAGVPFKEDSDSIFVSLFKPQEQEQKSQKQSKRSDVDDDIPF